MALLLGIWENEKKIGSEDVSMEFRENGDLIYVIIGAGMEQKIFMKYEIYQDIIITNQPSSPKREETKFILDGDKLLLEFKGEKSLFIRSKE